MAGRARMTGDIQHDATRQRYFVVIDGAEAYLTY